MRCFNPHPALWPDATIEGNPVHGKVGLVSILTRRSGRMLRLYHGAYRVPIEVSILTRRSGRMLRRWTSSTRTCSRVSILTRRSGRMLRSRILASTAALLLFQSSPGALAGCYPVTSFSAESVTPVSILTRRSGRMLPPPDP